MNQKTKQEATRKLMLYIGEFKAKCKVNLATKDWDSESQELIEYLHYQWNVFCLQKGLHNLARLFLVETKVAKDVILNIRKEKESREYWTNELKKSSHDRFKNKRAN